MWCQAMWQSSGADNRQENWYWRYFSQGKNDHFSLFKVKDDEIGGGVWQKILQYVEKQNIYRKKTKQFQY